MVNSGVWPIVIVAAVAIIGFFIMFNNGTSLGSSESLSGRAFAMALPSVSTNTSNTSNGSISPTCGNGVCESDPIIFSPPESMWSCPQDCPVVCSPPLPGNWTNSSPSQPANASMPCCGNGVCESYPPFGPETPAACSSDCKRKCEDLRDNDGDRRIDRTDPGCHIGGVYSAMYIPWRDCEAEPFVCGDINIDGRVTVLDSLLIGRVLQGAYTPTVQQRFCGDVNSNGRLEAGDAALINRVAAGQPVTLRCDIRCTRNSC